MVDIPIPSAPPLRIERWNLQAWPPVTFGLPAAWTDVDTSGLGWLLPERRLPPDAPVLGRSRILAAARHLGEHGPWEIQLREFDTPAMASYVIENPQRWATGRSQVGQLDGAPEVLSAGGGRAVMLTYTCRIDADELVLAEVWLTSGRAYFFVSSAPAADRQAWLLALRTVLANVRQAPVDTPIPTPEHPEPGPVVQQATPTARYRCSVQSRVPVTLQNVTVQQPRMFVIGSPSMVAWSMLGVAAASMYGHAKASGREGRSFAVPATGDVTLMEDRLLLHLVAGTRVAGVTLRADERARTVELDIPYSVVRRFGLAAPGVYVDVVGRGVLWLQTGDNARLLQWLEHLAHRRTWHPPAPRPPLVSGPIAGWCQQDPRYTFGLPAGWVAAPPAALADYGALFSPSVLRCGVLLDGGPHEAQVFVIELGPAHHVVSQPDEEGLAATLVEGLVMTGPLESTTLDGEALFIVRSLSNDPAGPTDRCLGAVVRNGTAFALWYGTVGGSAGDGSYERWLADFHSMLATWHWYG